MLRRLFRLGFKLGIVGAIAFAISKAVKGRSPQVGGEPVVRAVADAPPSAADAWTGADPVAPPAEAATAAEAPAPTDAPVATAVADTWIEPDADGGCAASHPIKAKLSSSIFHQPGGMNYDRTRADRCYLDAGAAEADGLRAAKR